MKNKVFGFFREEKAAASIVEYSIVLPFCLFILVFLIMVGYFLNQRAVLDAAATRAVLVAQKVYTDINYTDIVDYGNDDVEKDYVGYKTRKKDLNNLRTEPYRYLVDCATKETTAYVEEQMEERAKKIVTYHQLVQLDSRVTDVEVEATVSGIGFKKAEIVIKQKFYMPIGKAFQFGEEENYLFAMNSQESMFITNPTEVIRNVDFALDTVTRFTGEDITKEITKFFGKITDFFKGK